MTSLEIRLVPPGFVVRTHDGETATVTDECPVQSGAIVFVTPRVWNALVPQIKQALGLGE